MERHQETELFDFLSRNSRFRDWLTGRLEAEHDILVKHSDIEQIRRAQGRAQVLLQMLELLDKAPAAMKR